MKKIRKVREIFEKINLVEKAVILDERRGMGKQNTYPLVVILDEAEFENYNFGLENNTLFLELPSFQELMNYFSV